MSNFSFLLPTVHVIKCILAGFSFVWIVAGCGSVAPKTVMSAEANAAVRSDRAVWDAAGRSAHGKNSFRMTLKSPKGSVTGICVLKMDGDGDGWRGTLMNEMGAKAFDFIVTSKNCTLLNVVAMMNKWYIKKTVAADLYFFLNADNPKTSFYKDLERFELNGNLIVARGKRRLLVRPDGSMLWINGRRGLQYEWKKIMDIDPDKIIE
jgi:hypothetical protein